MGKIEQNTNKSSYELGPGGGDILNSYVVVILYMLLKKCEMSVSLPLAQ